MDISFLGALAVVLVAVFAVGAVGITIRLLEQHRRAVYRNARWERELSWGEGVVCVGVTRVGRAWYATNYFDYHKLGEVEMAPGQTERFMALIQKADQTAKELNEYMEFGRRH